MTKKPKRYYVVMALHDWASVQVMDIPVYAGPNDPVGFLPVFTNRRKAERAYPKKPITIVEEIND